jgi:hypothetical protein
MLNTPALIQLFCLQHYLLRKAMVLVTSPWLMPARREQQVEKSAFAKDVLIPLYAKTSILANGLHYRRWIASHIVSITLSVLI